MLLCLLRNTPKQPPMPNISHPFHSGHKFLHSCSCVIWFCVQCFFSFFFLNIIYRRVFVNFPHMKSIRGKALNCNSPKFTLLCGLSYISSLWNGTSSCPFSPVARSPRPHFIHPAGSAPPLTPELLLRASVYSKTGALLNTTSKEAQVSDGAAWRIGWERFLRRGEKKHCSKFDMTLKQVFC